MAVYVTLSTGFEDISPLITRLEKFYEVQVSVENDKLKICGSLNKLNCAQVTFIIEEYEIELCITIYWT